MAPIRAIFVEPAEPTPKVATETPLLFLIKTPEEAVPAFNASPTISPPVTVNPPVAEATVMFAEPSKDTPPIVRAVVRVAALPVVFWLRVGKSPAEAVPKTPEVTLAIPVPVARLIVFPPVPENRAISASTELAVSDDTSPPPPLPVVTVTEPSPLSVTEPLVNLILFTFVAVGLPSIS